MENRIEVPRDRIEAFCRKWGVTALALFGSVLTPDFRPDSDLDVLVTFETGSRVSLFGFAEMQEELSEMFGREVDLVEKVALRNPFVRNHVLHHNHVIYAA
jgi:predicted nucleotidyltransferase